MIDPTKLAINLAANAFAHHSLTTHPATRVLYQNATPVARDLAFELLRNEFLLNLVSKMAARSDIVVGLVITKATSN